MTDLATGRVDAPRPQTPPERTIGSTLGLVPLLAAIASIGLLLIAIADARSRSMTSGSQALFWIGVILIYGSIVLRLVHPAAGRVERLSLVALLGLALYMVKVFRDPFGFTFADELVHMPNAEAIIRTHHLFHANPTLAATPSYPGLESIAAGLSSLSGLSIYGSGLIVIGVARLLIVLALFLLVERLLGSARAAGIAVAVYAANSNFVFFSAQFSYESLALPLLVVVLFAYAEWRDSAARPTYAAAILLVTLAIVATHHLTSYALAATLLVVAILYRFFGARNDTPARFAAFAAVAAVAWLVIVATATVDYLSPVVTRAVSSIYHTVTGESAPRQLFAAKAGSGGSAGGGSGSIEHAVALFGVAVLLVLYSLGLRDLWRGHRRMSIRDPFTKTIAVGGGLMFVMYGLRFAPQAWETANRSSEFLFLGLALVVPVAVLRLAYRLPERAGTVLATALLAIAFAGGVIAGWTPSLRLSQPYEIDAQGHKVAAEGRALASWARVTLGPGRRYASAEADARMLNSYAAGFARAGQAPDMADILQSPTLAPWELPLLRKYHVRYVVADRRARAFDNTAGYFFGFRRGVRRDRLLGPSAVSKFDRFDRIFDSGNIVVFDLHGPK